MPIIVYRNTRIRSWLPWLAEAAGSLFIVWEGLRYWLAYFHRGTNLLDEGSQAAYANRILHGDLIYRDFVTVVTPGSYYIVAWLFDLFGPNFMVLRWTALAIGLGIMIATLAVARHLVSWPFAAAAAFLTTVWGWFLVAPNLYSWQAMFLALIALLCYLRYTRTHRLGWIVGAGLVAGATILVKQNTGIYAATALTLTIWLSYIFERSGTRQSPRQRARLTMWFISGASVVVVPVVLLLLLAGAGVNLFENWIYYPQNIYLKALSLPYPSFYPLSPQPGLHTLGEAVPALLAGRVPEPTVYEIWTQFVLYLPVVVYPAAFVLVIWLAIRYAQTAHEDVAREGHTLLAIALFGACTFLQAWPRSDVTHILFGMQPCFIVLGYLSFCLWRVLDYFPGRLRARLPWVIVLEAVLMAVTLLPQAGLLWNGYKLTEFQYQNFYVPIQTERARGILTSAEEVQRVDRVTEYITSHTARDEPIFVVPWAAGFYFLTDRRNATRFDIFYDGGDEAYPCVIVTLDAQRPKYVIYGYVWDVDGKHFSDYARPIDQYIRSHYRIETTVAGYEIWRRMEGISPIFTEGASRCDTVPNVPSPARMLRSLRRLLQTS